MNIIEELKKLDVEITEDIEKKFKGDFISSQESEKKMSKLEADRDNWKSKAETAEETLKGFEGKDFDAITKERDEWKSKSEQAEKDYNAKLEDIEKTDLLKEAFKDIKFTSESAKSSIYNAVAKDVMVKDGKLIGFDDLIKSAREKDENAFVKEESQTRSQFTSSIAQVAGNNGTDMAKMRAVMGLSNENK